MFDCALILLGLICVGGAIMLVTSRFAALRRSFFYIQLNHFNGNLIIFDVLDTDNMVRFSKQFTDLRGKTQCDSQFSRIVGPKSKYKRPKTIEVH